VEGWGFPHDTSCACLGRPCNYVRASELRIMELGLGFGGSGLGVGGVGFGGRGLGFRIEGLGSRDWVSGCRSEELGVGN